MTARENWLPILDYENLYDVSDLGRVRSVTHSVTSHSDGRERVFRGRILKHELRNGYPTVGLSKNGIVTKFYVHYLVLRTFRGEPLPGQEACHGPDDDRTNVRLDNLRWDTHKSNVHDCLDHGRHRSHNGEKTRCDRGHPFDEANTIIRPEGRSCRKCKLMMERERYHRNKTS